MDTQNIANAIAPESFKVRPVVIEMPNVRILITPRTPMPQINALMQPRCQAAFVIRGVIGNSAIRESRLASLRTSEAMSKQVGTLGRLWCMFWFVNFAGLRELAARTGRLTFSCQSMHFFMRWAMPILQRWLCRGRTRESGFVEPGRL